jgi:negative regulator of sigma E activity
MNEASRLLDGELTDAELTTLLERLKHDAALRDEVTAQQLIRDGLAGLRSLDAGYSLRILARLHQAQRGKG